MSFFKDKNKYDRNGIIGTVLFHVILVLLFIFFGFSAPYPPPPEEGIEVNLGYSDQGMGEVQPEEPAPVEETAPQNKSANTNENIITQNTEESSAIRNNKKNNTETTEPENKEPVVNENALYRKSNNSKTNGGNEGETGRPGDQGNENGDPNAKNHYGNPDKGDVPSYSLTGRMHKLLPKPNYNSNEQGKVVVEIYVNKKGKVTRAIAGVKGTTTSDRTLWQLSQSAALKAEFDENPYAPEEQKGTITYNYVKLH